LYDKSTKTFDFMKNEWHLILFIISELQDNDKIELQIRERFSSDSVHFFKGILEDKNGNKYQIDNDVDLFLHIVLDEFDLGIENNIVDDVIRVDKEILNYLPDFIDDKTI